MTGNPPQHVSRWRLYVDAEDSQRASDGDRIAAAAARHVSLRYLNEFVGNLQCSPALLQHGLFPDAKEVTETMGLFNAVRRYLLPTTGRQEAEARDATEKPDGIVVVGDGNTPRSAAMFAFRLHDWKCYSIDPAMEDNSTERSRGWSEIDNLVVIRNKIENVRIALRRVIVVLVHAHVTLEQAVGAVDAEEVVGVVTMPCCNWYSRQEELFSRHPDLVYDDFSILSDHREMRLWIGAHSNDVGTAHSDLAEFAAADLMKGCVKKTFVSEWPGSQSSSGVATPARTKAERRHDTNASAFIDAMLSGTASAVSADSQQQPVIEPVDDATIDAVAANVPVDAHILVLDERPGRPWIQALAGRGYANLYCLSKPESNSEIDDGDDGVVDLEVQRYRRHDSDTSKMTVGACGHIQLDSVVDVQNGTGPVFNVKFSRADGESIDTLTHVLDGGFLYRGLRPQPKNSELFRNVCALLQQIAAASHHDSDSKYQPPSMTFASVTRAKTWRRKDFLAHPALAYDIKVTPTSVAADPRSRFKPEVVFFCRKRETPVSPAPVDGQSTNGEASIDQISTRDRVLEYHRLLAGDFDRAKSTHAAGLAALNATDAANMIRDRVADDSSSSAANSLLYIVVTGQIIRIRRYSRGMAFITLIEADAADRSSPDAGLQVFVQQQAWQSAVSFADTLALLRKGESASVVGFARTNERGKPMLQAVALTLLTGEFASY